MWKLQDITYRDLQDNARLMRELLVRKSVVALREAPLACKVNERNLDNSFWDAEQELINLAFALLVRANVLEGTKRRRLRPTALPISLALAQECTSRLLEPCRPQKGILHIRGGARCKH